MNATVTPPPKQTLMTGEEFFAKHEHDHVELREGHIVELPMPSVDHAFLCGTVARILGNHVADHRLGRVGTNDAFIRLSRDPDTVRGPDICYYSFKKLPRDQIASGICDVIPELVCEVRSPSNTWNDIFIKIGEYLQAGVQIVLVFDNDTQTVSIYRFDTLQQTLSTDDTLELPDLFPGFAVPVERFFA